MQTRKRRNTLEYLPKFLDRNNWKTVIINTHNRSSVGLVVAPANADGVLPGLVVTEIVHGGPAERCGAVHVGDQVMTMNGTSVIGMPFQQAIQLVKDLAQGSEVSLQIVETGGKYMLPRERAKDIGDTRLQKARYFLDPDRCLTLRIVKRPGQVLGMLIHPTGNKGEHTVNSLVPSFFVCGLAEGSPAAGFRSFPSLPPSKSSSSSSSSSSETEPPQKDQTRAGAGLSTDQQEAAVPSEIEPPQKDQTRAEAGLATDQQEVAVTSTTIEGESEKESKASHTVPVGGEATDDTRAQKEDEQTQHATPDPAQGLAVASSSSPSTPSSPPSSSSSSSASSPNALRLGDVLMAVNGRSLVSLTQEAVVQVIRGVTAGSQVNFTVVRTKDVSYICLKMPASAPGAGFVSLQATVGFTLHRGLVTQTRDNGVGHACGVRDGMQLMYVDAQHVFGYSGTDEDAAGHILERLRAGGRCRLTVMHAPGEGPEQGLRQAELGKEGALSSLPILW